MHACKHADRDLLLLHFICVLLHELLCMHDLYSFLLVWLNVPNVLCLATIYMKGQKICLGVPKNTPHHRSFEKGSNSRSHTDIKYCVMGPVGW